jgi:hypothetical protein
VFSGQEIARFWKQVHKTDRCWRWTGHISRDGHGKVSFRKRTHYTHRVAYELAHGALPAGAVVRHSCDTPACVRPEHLLLGTHADNVADRIARGRSAVGTQNGRSKLDVADVQYIRRVQGAATPTELGRKFGVDRKVIRDIWNGLTWKHLEP